ncbi:MAG: PD-(D/E)XK nuclease family transposase [Lachnoclostridium sp.]|nr:PD-(D/E)XK nuclease family transposase [Lachnoclostridium sp.]
MISDKGSQLFLDIIVEFENGELADVEIQKVGVYFPGQRASCYASDMVMRQYERQRSLRGDDFTYQDMKKVYTIVLVEKHSKELKEIENEYLHRGEWKFDTGLQLELLEEFFFISLENFFKIEDNKEDTKGLSELEAWMYFIGSDKPEHIRKVIENFPWFAELYEDVAYFRHHPEEAIGMFSEALRKLDENTINFMIDDMKGEIEGLKKELADWQKALDDKKKELASKDKELADRDKELADRDKELADKVRKLQEQEQEILELKKMLGKMSLS